jgi:hypothetical protein
MARAAFARPGARAQLNGCPAQPGVFRGSSVNVIQHAEMNAKSLLPALLLAVVQAAHVAPTSAQSAPVAAQPAAAQAAVRPTLLPALTEQQKIDALIGSVEHLPGAVFIRNGTEYDGAKAAAHLRTKLGYAGKRITTAEQFIDKLATASSMTGKPYLIRFADGHTVESAVFFRDQLKRLQAGHRAATAKG